MSYHSSHLIAAWYFEVDPGVLEAESPAGQLAHAAELGCGPLVSTRLLIPRVLILDGWVEDMDGRPRPAGLPELRLGVAPPVQAASVLADITDRAAQSGKPDALPLLSFHGATDVITPAGTTTEDELMALELAYEGGGVTVVLSTFTAIWLPYDLKAQPQFAIGRRNGPRLDYVLSTLSESLGAAATPSAQTRYAVATERGLQNARYSDGAVAVVSPD